MLPAWPLAAPITTPGKDHAEATKAAEKERKPEFSGK
jgi:hypothetical protein